jgi:hypothetical protein
MKVLYLWNTAGASTPIAKWLIKNGHDAKILVNRKYDPYNTSPIDAPYVVSVYSSMDFKRAAFKLIRTFKPDVIHVNSALDMVIIARILAPRSIIVFEYHGWDIRGNDKVHSEALLAQKIIVSTHDLVQYGDVYGCPIEDFFYYRGGRVENSALCMPTQPTTLESIEKAKTWSEKHNMKLTVTDRVNGVPINIKDMPLFLSQFEYYIDFRSIALKDYLSKTAIEAIKCGCKVVEESKFKIITEFIETTPQDFFNLYSSLRRLSVFRTIKMLFRLLLNKAFYIQIRQFFLRYVFSTIKEKLP